jgi:NADH dehydrogenase (ubiquinone) Fe-S protein 5
MVQSTTTPPTLPFHLLAPHTQSSGFGVKGSVGRCYPIWSAFEKCLATKDHFKDCMDFRDDYVECLHHRKEVGGRVGVGVWGCVFAVAIVHMHLFECIHASPKNT